MADLQLLTQQLDLIDLQVTKYELAGLYEVNIYIESALKMTVCPYCQKISKTVRETTPYQAVRDKPMWGKRCWLHYAPRRFKCESCRKLFIERMDWFNQYGNTPRYEQHIFERMLKEPISLVARSEKLSEEAVQKIFDRQASAGGLFSAGGST